MKTYLIIIVILICSASEKLSAQYLKINAGMSFSSLDFKAGEIKFFDSGIKSFYPSLGVDYLERKYFYFSSEIGLLEKGGKSNVSLRSIGGKEEMNVDIVEKWRFLHFNTTFRIKLPFDKFHLYAGIGPKFDMLLGSNSFNSGFEGYGINRYSFGFKPEIGFNTTLTNKISAGFNLSYLFDIDDFAKDELFTITNNTWIAMLSLRYQLSR